MASVIEDHPQLNEINRAILNKQSIDAIVKWVSPQVSRATIQRYRARVLAAPIKQHARTLAKRVVENVTREVPALSEAQIRGELDQQTIAQPFRKLLDKKLARYDRWIDIAHEKGDVRGFAAVDSAETRAIELDARLAHALDPSSQNAQTINIAVVLPAPVQPASGASGVTLDIAAVKVEER